MFKAKIIADSTCNGNRLTTYELTYPRFIHSEMLTHRVFSRNAASSRAIPITKMLEAIEASPAAPVWWGANQAGMQASVELTESKIVAAKEEWAEAMTEALEHAETLAAIGTHKQIANRVVEPFSHITVILSSTNYHNFFKLRAHKDAQPEFQVLAYAMLKAYLASPPTELRKRDWHVPLISKSERVELSEERIVLEDHPVLLRSVARCARVSYVNHGRDYSLEDDLNLVARLSSSGHWSPFEHVAQAVGDANRYGNFKGWKQLRNFYAGESGGAVFLEQIMADMPDWVRKLI